MGGEIVTLHIGQAGVQISHALWELVCVEHGVTADGRRVVESYNLDEFESGREYVFREVHKDKHVPRALLIDLEPTVIDEIRVGAYRGLWNPLNLISGKEDAASNFARGYYSQTRIEMADLMERVRILVEQCDNMACFKLLYSANGGTGSGLTSALCERLSDEYGKKHKFATTVYPSPGYSELMVEPYNALLHSSTNLTFCDCVVMTDNEATLNVAEDSLRLHHEGFTVPNRVIANAVTTQFLSHRYNFINQQRTHVDELLINLIPYPRIHFPMMAFAPFLGPSCQDFEKTDAVDLVRSVFEDTNQLLSVSAFHRAYISCALLFRGAISPLEAIQAVGVIRGDRMSRARFVDWCPTGFKLGMNVAAPNQAPTHNTVVLKKNSLSMIAGNLSIYDVWTGIGRRFDQLYAKRAYVHWYVGEGMEEGEFSLAREVIQQLVEDYEAIAKDAEGAFFDTSMNQSQNQLEKWSVHVSPVPKRSSANVNQGTTLDDPNSMRTLEQLSLDTNQHHCGYRGSKRPQPSTRIREESEGIRAGKGIRVAGKRADSAHRVNIAHRRRLHASEWPIQMGRIGDEGQRKSFNPFIESTSRKQMYGSNCSAAIKEQIPRTTRTNHRCRKQRANELKEALYRATDITNYVRNKHCHKKTVDKTENRHGEACCHSGIPVFSNVLYEAEIRRKVERLSSEQSIETISSKPTSVEDTSLVRSKFDNSMVYRKCSHPSSARARISKSPSTRSNTEVVSNLLCPCSEPCNQRSAGVLDSDDSILQAYSVSDQQDYSMTPVQYANSQDTLVTTRGIQSAVSRNIPHRCGVGTGVHQKQANTSKPESLHSSQIIRTPGAGSTCTQTQDRPHRRRMHCSDRNFTQSATRTASHVIELEGEPLTPRTTEKTQSMTILRTPQTVCHELDFTAKAFESTMTSASIEQSSAKRPPISRRALLPHKDTKTQVQPFPQSPKPDPVQPGSGIHRLTRLDQETRWSINATTIPPTTPIGMGVVGQIVQNLASENPIGAESMGLGTNYHSTTVIDVRNTSMNSVSEANEAVVRI